VTFYPLAPLPVEIISPNYRIMRPGISVADSVKEFDQLMLELSDLLTSDAGILIDIRRS